MLRTYKATVNHAGKMNHQITKEGLSAAEVVLLMNIHGPGAVSDIYEQEKIKTYRYKVNHNNGTNSFSERPATMQDEKTFLSERYGEKAFGEVYPGFAPMLPTSLEQVGIEFIALGQSASVEQFPHAGVIDAGNEEEDTPAPMEDPRIAAKEEKKKDTDGLRAKLPAFLGGN